MVTSVFTDLIAGTSYSYVSSPPPPPSRVPNILAIYGFYGRKTAQKKNGTVISPGGATRDRIKVSQLWLLVRGGVIREWRLKRSLSHLHGSHEKGQERAIVNQTNIETISNATWEHLLRDGVERIRAFPSAYIPSWTELLDHIWDSLRCEYERLVVLR